MKIFTLIIHVSNIHYDANSYTHDFDVLIIFH